MNVSLLGGGLTCVGFSADIGRQASNTRERSRMKEGTQQELQDVSMSTEIRPGMAKIFHFFLVWTPWEYCV